jgi:hypothetical protein
MGRHVRCRVRNAGKEAEATSLLETDEVIVRSPFRLTIPRTDITASRVEQDWLEIEHPGGRVALELGSREAEKWAHDLAHPKTLADKLGIKAGQRVKLVGELDRELLGAGTLVESGEADVVFLRIDDPADLDRLRELRGQIAPDGAIWAIRPKGRKDLTEAMVLAAGRDAGLTDVKTARVSDALTGERFVIPRDQR